MAAARENNHNGLESLSEMWQKMGGGGEGEGMQIGETVTGRYKYRVVGIVYYLISLDS